MSLRTTLVLALLLAIALPLVSVAMATYWYFDNKLREEAETYQRDLSEQLQRSMQADMDRLSLAAKSLSESTVISEYFLAEGVAMQDIMRPVVLELFASYEQAHMAIDEIQLWNKDFQREVSLSNSSIVVPAVVDEQLLKDAIEQGNDVELFIQHQQQGLSYLVAVAPIFISPEAYEARTEPVGVGYMVAISPFDLLQNEADRGHSDTVSFFFADELGRFLTEPVGIEFPRQFNLPQFFSDTMLLNNDMAADLDGKSYLFRFYQLHPQLWLGAVIDNHAITLASARFIKQILLPLLLVLLVIAMVFFWFVSHWLIAPIDRLIEATRRVARGEFDLQLGPASNDELGQLSRAFCRMSEKVNQSSKKIKQLAFYDPLTQLPNRNTLRNNLELLIRRSERNGQKIAVLFIDLDDFKKVNDSLGHAAGDELLIQVSERLKHCLRISDEVFNGIASDDVEEMLSRRGGDEFNALLTGIHSAHDAAHTAERLVDSLSKPFSVMGIDAYIGASIGIALYPDDGSTADQLLKNADLAMYEAKAEGKNNYHIYTEAINQQVHQRLSLEQDIRRAIETGAFELFYQPKFNLQTLAVTGYEALIRWQHPQKGLVSPAEFIPLAEESSLILDLGCWVLQTAARQIHSWRDSLLLNGERIAVNVSAKQLSKTDFVSQLRTIFGEARAPLEYLEIELTETSLFNDEPRAFEHLTALRELGVKISLDDFGTGYSSLSFLRRFPIDIIKIDRSFVAEVTHAGDNRAIVTSLLQLCQQIHLQVVAEGVETAEHAEFLLTHGCQQAQGFYFAKPMPSDQVVALYSQN